MARLTLSLIDRSLALRILAALALASLGAAWLTADSNGAKPMVLGGYMVVFVAFFALAAAVKMRLLGVMLAQRCSMAVFWCGWVAGMAHMWLGLDTTVPDLWAIATLAPWQLCLTALLFFCVPPMGALTLALGLAALSAALPWLLGVPSSTVAMAWPVLASLALAQALQALTCYFVARQTLRLAAAGQGTQVRTQDRAVEGVTGSGRGRAMSVRDLVSQRERDLQSLLAQAEQSHRDAALHAAESQAMLEAYPGAVFKLDLRGVFGFANAHAADLFGVPSNHLVGSPATQWLGEAAYQQCLARNRVIQSTGQPLSFEATFVQPDGGHREYWMTQFMVATADGQAPWVYQVGVDITARKQAERALIDAKAEAERANLAKSRFMSRMSHELRTPLNAVLGLAQLLRVQASQGQAPQVNVPQLNAPHLNVQQQGHLDTIADAGKELLALVDETMDLSRMDAGEMRVACVPVNLSSLVTAALHAVGPMALAQRVALAPSPMRRELWVQGDPVRLRQVLLNLLSNAIKYNRSGGGVAVRMVACSGDVKLVVQDTGQGLTPQQQAQLFEPYNRLGAERSGVQGTGVGLSIARGLATLMGGRLDVRSTVGVGSEFALYLRQVAAPVAAGLPWPDSALGALQENRDVRGSVLYVEDNDVNVLVFGACLARRPEVRLHVANNAAQALALARREPLGLVVLDLNLPDMSGLELARQLRQLPALAGVPMALLTADATPQTAALARDQGFQKLWHKPFDAGQLLADVDILLERVSA
jgi:PAS domain S-box-containing protein